MRNVIIIGSGPAGLTAALYTSRAMLSPLVITGLEPGGQLTTTTQVDNYPGFPDGIMGPDLMADMKKQAERFGAEFIDGEATKAELTAKPFKVWVEERVFEAKTVIIASGASARLLGLESEKKLMGKGVSTCATCDGFFFKDKEIVIVGGGDSAMEEAVFLTRFATKVSVIHRRDELRASKIMQEKAFQNKKIEFIWNTVVDDILESEQGTVKGVRLKNVDNKETFEKDCEGVFIAIGHIPNTGLFKGQLEMDDQGYIIIKDGSRTSVPGVFAAGDVHDHVYKQAVTAAGSGCRAALDTERYLEAEGDS
jgi:thioredoxin reductase (NADPH)